MSLTTPQQEKQTLKFLGLTPAHGLLCDLSPLQMAFYGITI